jgi:hypothetical protein
LPAAVVIVSSPDFTFKFPSIYSPVLKLGILYLPVLTIVFGLYD